MAAVQPVQTAAGALAPAAAAPAARRAPSATAAAPAAPAAKAAATPAASVQVTSVPASVAADDRAEYRLLLRQFNGNAAAALASLRSAEAAEKDG